MTNSTEQLFKWYDERTLRERVVVLVCLAVVLLFFAYLFALAPQAQQRKSAELQLSVLNNELAALALQEQEILSRGEIDPNRENLQHIEALEREISVKQGELQERIVNLVAPHDMPELLHDLLDRDQRLKLVHLENLAPQRVAFGRQDQNGKKGDDEDPVLYRHRLKLEFVGTYLSALDYLKGLQELPQAVVWDSIEIETDKYPEAKVRLQVHTLSLSEGWIGG